VPALPSPAMAASGAGPARGPFLRTAPALPGPAGAAFLRTALALSGLAVALRLAVAAWAPGLPGADGALYHQYARILAAGGGYVNLDGSPAIRWMPGWPALLSLLYRVFGDAPRVGMLAGALFDGAAAGLVALLGARLFGAATGRRAGLAYALWPGMIAYAATLFVEPLFNLLWVAALALLAAAGSADRRRAGLFAAAGLALGLCTWVKAEPPTLGPALLLYLWRVRRSGTDFARAALAVGGVAAAVVAPWTLRNYLAFERFIPTAASGAIGAQLANRPGASGGQDFAANRALQQRYRGRNSAETTLNRYDAGFRDAWAFAREHPAEQLAIVASKLRITYGGDHQALRTMRNAARRRPQALALAPGPYAALVAATDACWFALLGLAALGLLTLRRWPRGAGVLVLGPLVTWLALHVAFLGGQRYHAPQVPELALLAGCGAGWIGTRLGARVRAWRRPGPPGT
jgi:4-amino-4-deoxy-L-arabinose transferase-like glycosyltransferase